jgi:hypothetical protein
MADLTAVLDARLNNQGQVFCWISGFAHSKAPSVRQKGLFVALP